MSIPAPATTTRATLRIFAPWVVFIVLVGIGLVCFFLYADRVPSLLQTFTDR
ncbi:MAG: hypothetical protein NTW72_05420 [Gemmatimonadetes bacterium]|jgi:hypothetical protein|nr:hypothetical protein [Gemmatimonadota bacterium]